MESKAQVRAKCNISITDEARERSVTESPSQVLFLWLEGDESEIKLDGACDSDGNPIQVAPANYLKFRDALAAMFGIPGPDMGRFLAAAVSVAEGAGHLKSVAGVGDDGVPTRTTEVTVTGGNPQLDGDPDLQ